MNKKRLGLLVIGVCIALALLGHFVEGLGFLKAGAFIIGFMGAGLFLVYSSWNKTCPKCFGQVPDRSYYIRHYGYTICPICGQSITGYYDDGKSGPTL